MIFATINGMNEDKKCCERCEYFKLERLADGYYYTCVKNGTRIPEVMEIDYTSSQCSKFKQRYAGEDLIYAYMAIAGVDLLNIRKGDIHFRSIDSIIEGVYIRAPWLDKPKEKDNDKENK